MFARQKNKKAQELITLFKCELNHLQSLLELEADPKKRDIQEEKISIELAKQKRFLNERRYSYPGILELFIKNYHSATCMSHLALIKSFAAKAHLACKQIEELASYFPREIEGYKKKLRQLYCSSLQSMSFTEFASYVRILESHVENVKTGKEIGPKAKLECLIPDAPCKNEYKVIDQKLKTFEMNFFQLLANLSCLETDAKLNNKYSQLYLDLKAELNVSDLSCAEKGDLIEKWKWSYLKSLIAFTSRIQMKTEAAFKRIDALANNSEVEINMEVAQEKLRELYFSSLQTKQCALFADYTQQLKADFDNAPLIEIPETTVRHFARRLG